MKRIVAALVAVALVGPVLGVMLMGSEPEAQPQVSQVPQAAVPAEAPTAARIEFDADDDAPASVAPPATALPQAMNVAAAEPEKALGRPVSKTTLAQGAAEVSQYLVHEELLTDEALALTRAIANDPDMAGLLSQQASAWRASEDPALRARGLLVQAGLGQVDAIGWQSAVGNEADPAARALMVEHVPHGASDEEDARLASGLLDLAQTDSAPEVRAAALGSLPRLDAQATQGVVSMLHTDPDVTVRRVAALHLRDAPADPALARGLLASAAQGQEDADVRRAAAIALIRMEERAPGTLAEAGGTREQLAEVLEATTGDHQG